MIAIFIFLLAYSSLSGIVEGILYGMKGSGSFKGNEHGFFVAKIAAIGLSLLVPVEYHWLDRAVLLASWWLCHSFFHDGFYYETRRQIDVPYYSWYFDRSTTSTARFEISFWIRTLLAIVGIALLTLYIAFC